jgi:transposase
MAGSPLSAPLELRARWYLQVDKYGRAVDEVCAIFGISRKTYYKWYRKDHGRDPQVHHASRPHPATKIFGKARVLLVEAKQQYNFGPRKMRAYLKQELGVTISPNAIYKFMKKKGLIRKPKRKQLWYAPMKQPYVALFPGDNIQLDVKYVPGGRGEWKYQFRFLDTVTNYQFAADYWSKDARTTIRAFQAAERNFPFAVRGIQTDNGGEFRGVFHEYLVKRGVPHRYIPKRSAPWNGKVERANRSVDDEYYLNVWRPWRSLRAYTAWYNMKRPHDGKGMNDQTPYQKFLTFIPKECHP